MIFVNTKREAEFLHDRLKGNGFPCRVISGDVEQKKRLKILDDFKSGRLPIMIGTDVASRGLHIEEVSHVINYDLPQDPEDYVHGSAAPPAPAPRGKPYRSPTRTAPSTWRRSKRSPGRRFPRNGPRMTCSCMTTCGASRGLKKAHRPGRENPAAASDVVLNGNRGEGRQLHTLLLP